MGVPALIVACIASLAAPRAEGDVLVARIKNEIIHPLTAQYLVQSIARADEDKAGLLVIELDTPGGLVDSTEEILQAMSAARTPVAVFVAPSAARAASAGFFILMASDVAAMAPSTNTGAAHPVGMSDAPETKDDIHAQKAENDLAARIRTLAEKHGRNVEIAEKAVRDSTAYTETEALAEHLIDLVARDRADLLEKLDGRRVKRLNGEETVLHTRGPVREVEKSFLQSVLGPILHPQLVLLLLGLGVMGLYVEISHPGLILPGVVGVLCLLLAALAFQFLPVNVVGLLLVVVGLGLFVLEIKVTSYGALTVGGFACLILGLLLMFPRDVPALRVPIGFVLPLAVAVGGVMTFFLVLVTRAQRVPVATGSQGMIGEIGRASTAVSSDGKVFVHGEHWDARSTSAVAAGDRVRVLAVEGARLVVEPTEKKESIA